MSIIASADDPVCRSTAPDPLRTRRSPFGPIDPRLLAQKGSLFLTRPTLGDCVGHASRPGSTVLVP